MNSLRTIGFALLGLQLYLSNSSKSYAADHTESGPKQTATNSPEYRLKWNLDTSVDDYEKSGKKNPKWDASAKDALRLFAEMRSSSNSSPKGTNVDAQLTSAVRLALTNGCDDPLLLYLSARYVMPSEKHSWKEQGDAYRAAAEGLSAGQHTPIRKFYAAVRAAEALHPGGNRPPQEVHHWRREASRFLNEAVADKAMPPSEVYEACDTLLKAVKTNTRQLEESYHVFEPIIFTNWPSESSLYLLKGSFYTEDAWKARGAGYADSVSEAGGKLFEDRLWQAEKALDTAWALNPKDKRIARQMMTVELGQGKGRARMEIWFKRATDLDPNYYDAFSAKLYYLEPKWYGLPEEMLKFGHECVESKVWGGQVPLILRDAHEALAKYLPADERAGYWRRPEVWKDIHAAFEKYFTLEPHDTRWRHTYTLYAYKAQQWDVLNQQIPLLGQVNYEYFGGKDEYEKMVRLAREHAKSA